jgi:hypothetical protein
MLATTKDLYSLGTMFSGRTTFRLALSQAPEHVEGEEWKRFMTLRFYNPFIGFSQAPEHVEGGLWHQRGEGRARHAADDCLNYYLFNVKKGTRKRNTYL